MGDQQKFAIDSVQDNIKMVSAMKDANKQMKTQMKKIDIDQVEDLHDDMEDMLDDMEEMNEVLGRDYGNLSDVDEDDLLDELDALDDDLDLDEDETPAYLISAQSAANKEEKTEVDEFGV